MAIPGRPPDGEIGELKAAAFAAYRAGRLARALALCRRILALEPERPDVLAFAGALAFDLGDAAEAVRLYGAAVRLRPDLVEAHYNMANALRQLGRDEAAIDSYRRALALRPDLVPAHHNLGVVLQSLGRHEAAKAAYERALDLAPEAAETHRNLGIVLEALDRPEDALRAFRRALAIRPDWPEAHSNLVNLLARAGRPEDVIAAADEWLAVDPANTEALSLKALACNEIGDREEVARLLDFDRFVEERSFPAPDGYADLAEFNEALAEHVLSHPTLKVPPSDDPTYHHPRLRITGELLAEPRGPMAALERMMRAAIEDYRKRLAGGPDHPFVAHWPERWRLSSWGVVLEGEGNLVSHIHLDGYLGGVYYVRLPDVVAADADEAGWFELGRPPDDLGFRAEPEVRAIRPAPGKMLLFPAYFYHRTVPFERPAQRRISIAFDLVPEDRAGPGPRDP